MPRTVKDPPVRRNEILDAAQKLIYTRGYEQMTIQDILDELHISKGAFYHYFDSKQGLLEALIGRMVDLSMEMFLPLLQNPVLPALEKLNRYFAAIATWKTGQKDYLMAILRIWYADENALVRQKLFRASMELFAPTFGQILRQGVQEGVFQVAEPEQTAMVVHGMMLNMGDALAAALLAYDAQRDSPERLVAMTQVHLKAIERVLCASPGSIKIFDPATLVEWLPPPARPTP